MVGIIILTLLWMLTWHEVRKTGEYLIDYYLEQTSELEQEGR